MIAYLLAQFVDIRIYHFWKQKTKGRMLWLRNNFSTFTSQFIDTFTVIFLLCSFGALPWDLFVGLLVSGFIFKVLVALIDTPLLYLGVYLFRKKFDFVFTTGGIGPTHDDKTSSAIASAFDDSLTLNKEAKKRLEKHYSDDLLTNARLKMAYLYSKKKT